MQKLIALFRKLPPPRLSARALGQQTLAGLRNARGQILETYREGGLVAFFGPGIRLLDRHGYTWKFTLLGVLTFTATGIYVVSLNISMRAEIATVRQEQRSLTAFAPLAQVLQASQNYRLQAWGATTDASLRASLPERAAAMDKALADAEQALRATSDPAAMLARIAAVRTSWQKTQGAQDSLDAENVRATLEPFAQQSVALLADLGEAGKLLADPQRERSLLADLLLRKYPQGSEALVELGQSSALVLGSMDMGSEWGRIAALDATATQAAAELQRALGRAAAVGAGDSLKTVAEEFGSGWTALQGIVDSEVRKGGFGGGGEVFQQAVRVPVESLQAGLAPARERLAGLLEAQLHTLEQRFFVSSVIGALLVGTLLYCALALFVTILGAVRELTEGARRIGSGELGYRIHYRSRDELRQVADQFNHMAQGFSEVIAQVRQTSTGLADSAHALRDASARVTQGSARQSQAATSMAAAVEQMTVGIDETARNAHAADEAARQSEQTSAQGAGTVSRTVAEMEQIAAAVRESATIIITLGEDSQRISSIVKSIKDIASQTNLLALNASIEAARAGEDGRGFAVVADEVRKLAQRTTAATAEIAAMVGAIQTGTGRAVAAMQDGVKRVHEGVSLSERAGAAMSQIREESGRVLGSVSDISSALREQGMASTEIARRVEDVARMADANHARIAHTADTASELVALSSELQDAISQFRLEAHAQEVRA